MRTTLIPIAWRVYHRRDPRTSFAFDRKRIRFIALINDTPRSSGSTPFWATSRPRCPAAFHALRYRKYGQIYLTAFAYLTNWGFDLHGIVAGFIVNAARSKPVPE
jgi:hypothetical protein